MPRDERFQNVIQIWAADYRISLKWASSQFRDFCYVLMLLGRKTPQSFQWGQGTDCAIQVWACEIYAVCQGKKKRKMFPYFIFSLYLRYSHILNKGVMIFGNRDKESKCMSSGLYHSFYKHKNATFLYVSSLSFVSNATILEWRLIKKRKSISCYLFTEKTNSSIFRVLIKMRLFFTPDWAARFQELLWIKGSDEPIISSEAVISSENDLNSLIYLMKEIAI